MTITAPSVAEFKLRYSAFEPVADARVALFLDDAVDAVNEGWADRDIPRGIMAYAGHLLSMEGEPARSVATASGASASSADRIVKRYTVGDVTEEYDTARESGAGQATPEGLDDTPYGRLYLELARRNTVSFIAI